MYIPYGRQCISEEDIQAVVDTLRSDYLTTGPKISEFEKVVAGYTGAKYAVAVSNGTAALHIACMAAGIGKGDEVITSPITFVASANCAFYCGATPVFADIDINTYNISPESIEKCITDKTRAIVAVHFSGQPCEMDKIREIADRHNLIVIEDAAHALGADYKGNKIGSISDMTTFSFHPVKHITTAEGGMVTTDNKELYEKLLLYRTHGITRNPDMLSKKDGAWYYEQTDLGYNYRITDVQCALGISQMKRLDKFVEKRRELVNRYNEAFAEVDEIVTPYQLEGCNNSYHLYVIRFKTKDRKIVFDKLREVGIGVNVHYIPVHTQPYYVEYYKKNGLLQPECPNAIEYYNTAISLPLYPELSYEQQDYVIEKVLELMS
ncbi:MAG: UDP-4-amino-4,6-dideoxy-N-acetyl-beta-L-altrosamine transaminase [Lachnospiraceae bacterium]|nr:UDP-4-amino-4,6-dideoxy-N-acetyl-beta-L-altrosamine transaminase [Lachnospiraceae bacterium]